MRDNGWALVVDADQRNALLNRVCAEQAGLKAEIVLDGDDALARLREERPTLVMLAMRLPGAPGDRVLRWIQERPDLAGVPVVVATTQSAPAFGPEDGVFYLPKPYRASQAARTIRAALRWGRERPAADTMAQAAASG